ncbi:STAS domain-containing protein [Micromonospora musae]|uniref:STAS domain-containing protein n=1 Tax=Micromonospora musae TaxID=1894970 RepID=A0A3A9Y424_9ACTN|nr:STAS domain-containing protein [Micromonospora musae]RKN20982.1 STAS domain-containing protein [Micromonospora musae]RKN32205.1 STAS domain-containing protein [Micromonospora musae]
MDIIIGPGVLRHDYYDVAPSTRYVTLTGEADLANAHQLERELNFLLAPAWVTSLILDLTALQFLDCAALAALLAVRKAALTRGQQVSITAAASTPARVLAITAVGRLFSYPPRP